MFKTFDQLVSEYGVPFIVAYQYYPKYAIELAENFVGVFDTKIDLCCNVYKIEKDIPKNTRHLFNFDLEYHMLINRGTHTVIVHQDDDGCDKLYCYAKYCYDNVQL